MIKYKRNVKLRTLYLTFRRKWFGILLVFVPIVLISVVTTQLIVIKTYISSVTLYRDGYFSESEFLEIKAYIKDASTIETTTISLDKNGVVHSDGSSIKSQEISEGIIFYPFTSSSLTITYSFQTSDKNITQIVLKELSEISTKLIVENAGSDYGHLVISSPANTPVKNSEENVYLLTALIGGAFFSIGLFFILEIADDVVYDNRDIEALESEGFEITVLK